MKPKLLLIVSGFCLVVASNAQATSTDTLYLRSREKQAVTIKEVYPDKIRYQRVGSQTGAVQTVPVKNVAYIVYTNGTRDVFNEFMALKPQINWVTESARGNQEELMLKACVLNNPGQIRLELNGVAVRVESRNFVPSETFCPQGTSFAQRVHLREGENQAVLIADNEGGETRSAPLKLWYKKGQERLALVIGNASYGPGNKLDNPLHDADDMTETLQKLGFEVLCRTDLNRQQMREAINEFGERLRNDKAQVGLFYYAGHGVQYQNTNFLVPVAAQLKSAGDIEFECEKADRVLIKMKEANVATKIVVLDACRTNPFDRSFSRGEDEQGLSKMRGPSGSFIAFATIPGQTAADGSGRNGVFTESILKALKIPNLTIEAVFKRVRNEVVLKTDNRQTPWDESSLVGKDFYFLKQ